MQVKYVEPVPTWFRSLRWDNNWWTRNRYETEAQAMQAFKYAARDTFQPTTIRRIVAPDGTVIAETPLTSTASVPTVLQAHILPDDSKA